MELNEAVNYFNRHQVEAVPIPGNLVQPTAEKEKEKTGEKEPPAATTSGTPPVKEGKAGEKAPTAGPAAVGPSGTAIKQVYDPRLDPPDKKSLKDLPKPQGEDSYFITLHPGYLEKSKFNEFSVDQESENFKELLKAIELTGVKDPVLARPKEDGGLEILSGQRRHIIASILNYPVPTIVQNIDDDDAKIIVADANLHRDKITSYDLSRALRMKMDGMKRKAGRRRKSDPAAKLLNTDEALAQEMGMTVSKLNKIVRLSEATKTVCGRYDDGTIELAIAYALSFLKPKNQETVMNLADVGYKLTTKRVERMKPLEKDGKLTDKAMRNILEDKDLEPKEKMTLATPGTPMPPADPSAPTPPADPPAMGGGETPPSSPETSSVPNEGVPGSNVQSEGRQVPEGQGDITKGKQERPEQTKIILTGDRLRKYFPDVSMTPREIEESIYEALEERERRRAKQKEKQNLLKGGKVK